MNPQEIEQPEIQLLYELVATPSVSGNELKASQAFVRHADRMGFESRIDEVGNAIAERGPRDGIHLMLLGHIDTVPGDIPVRIEDGILHGRGSVDAKGPLAAMLTAASKAKLPDNVRVTVIGAVGEEAVGSIGARHIVHQHTPDACIIGEPSGSDGITLGYKGRLICDTRVCVSNAHSAGQELSAPDVVMQWWSCVTAEIQRFNLRRERVFDQVQASLLSMHSESDGLTQQATIRSGFRLPLTMDTEKLQSVLTQYTSIDMDHRFSGSEDAYVTDRNDPVVRALSSSIRATGRSPRPKLKTGTADLNVVAPIWKCPIAAYGPGDSSLDHRPDEHLVLNEFLHSVEVLKATLESLSEELAAQKETTVIKAHQ